MSIPLASRRLRRTVAFLALLSGVATWLILNPASYQSTPILTEVGNEASASSNSANSPTQPVENSTDSSSVSDDSSAPLASAILAQLAVKGRAPKTGYQRTEFYNGWPTVDGCNLRQKIIKRDFGDSAVLDAGDPCKVIAGEYTEPYIGQHQTFTELAQISKGVQIDHVVALSDAWQKGAQYLPKETRYQIATDPLNLLAVDSKANQGKSDGDAATWLPPNKAFRCHYVARQVSVKYKYQLWVTAAEHDAIASTLDTCPRQPAIGL